MKSRVYIETSVISYLAARSSNEPIKFARQQASILLWRMADTYDFLCRKSYWTKPAREMKRLPERGLPIFQGYAA